MKAYIKVFQDVTAALFSSTELNEKMRIVFELLAQHIPLHAITFDQFNPPQRILDILFVTTGEKFFQTKISVPLSMSEALYLTRVEASHKICMLHDNSIAVVARAHSQALAHILPFAPRAYMASPLPAENGIVGHLVLMGTSPHCFTRKHEQFLSMLVGPLALTFSNIVKAQDIAEEKKKIYEEKTKWARQAQYLSGNTLVGASAGLKKVGEAIQQLQNMESPVLILGETGTGKELVASAIQENSRRRRAAFVKVNCGAIPESLLNSELFGHEKGAFTGASTLHVGRFEQANGGTLFLDEVGELSLHAQVHLLRVLQDGMIQRIGSTKTIKVNVRIIAATNRDLAHMRQQGLFREDLFHRLCVFPINVPPLRERLEDIPLLVKHLVDKAALRLGVPAPPILTKSFDSLMGYSWPGNVRELENLVERALILNPAGPLDMAPFLPSALRPLPMPPHSAEDPVLHALIDQRIAMALRSLPLMPLPAPQAPASFQNSMRELIENALERCHGKVYGPYGAAEQLQINHNTLRARMQKLGINPKQFRLKKTS
ncbi:MAG: sigma-54 dependent transcriptional regulator [Desulfovibrionaceae bacterium]